VRFEPEGDATRIRVKLEYLPPAGRAGAFVARLFGSAPDQQLACDLARLKQHLEEH
jgi:uncharacterized membrane protein